jgi:hypothetical protein
MVQHAAAGYCCDRILDVIGLGRRVRTWARVWLVCQLAAVSAFVPRDCCAQHRPAAAVARSHHDTGAAHHGQQAGHGGMHHETPASDHDRTCVMRGTCNGPLDAVATLFMGPGLPLTPYSLLDDSAARRTMPPADASALDSLTLPATPPPRA